MRAILTYHSIDPSGSPISVAPDRFREHVRWLASGRVRVVPLPELAARVPDGDDADAVALTFDDAFANLAAHALPLLHEAGLPATVFVVTGRVGATNGWAGTDGRRIPELPLLGWDALAALPARGFTLGAHGRTHRALAGLSASALHDELAGSADDLTRRTGLRPAAFAYPYGRVDAAAAAAVRATYAIGCTTELRPVHAGDDPALLPRLDAYYLRAPGALEAWGTPAFARRLRLRALARRLPRPGRLA